MSGGLQRFVAAQDAGGFRDAITELRAGRKTGHWIWYVFPQLQGLGRSELAQRFGLEDEDEAADYLGHELLRERLCEATGLVREQLCDKGAPITRLMGSEIDALKLVSSMTLFERVAAENDRTQELAADARWILEAAAAQGLPRCRFTLDALG